MKDAYSFDRDVDAAGAQLRRDVRRLRAHLQAPGARLPRGRGRHRRHRRRPLARVPGHRRHRRGRDRLLPDSRLRRQHRAGRSARAGRRRAGAGRRRWRRCRRPARRTCEDVAELLGLPLARTVKSLVLATDERDAAGDVPRPRLAAAGARRPRARTRSRPASCPGLERGFRFATDAEIEAHFGCRPGYLGPVGTRRPVRIVADRTVAAMSDFVCGANEADFHLTRRQLGPRPARARPGRRHPQRRRRRSVARRPRRARDPARHRGRPRLLPRHQVLRGDERDLSRRAAASRS